MTSVARTKSQSEDLMLFPRPLARQMISEKESINLFNQLLLIRDSQIVVITQKIISLAYFNKFSYRLIVSGTNYVERVIYGMGDKQAADVAAQNFRELFFLIQEDAPEEVKRMLGTFATYGYLESDLDEGEAEKVRVYKEKIFEIYPLFRLLPWAMIHILIRKGWGQDII